MVQRRIEKVVVAQLLEATRGVLDHVSRWLNQLNEAGESPPPGLSRLYGTVRRLRDHLHRLAVSSYTREVAVDLGPDDENLLVSCAVHHIGCIDVGLPDGARNPQDRAWLESARQSLATWAVRLASRPVARIPSPDAVRLNTPAVRGVVAAIARSTTNLDLATTPAPTETADTFEPAAPLREAPPLASSWGFPGEAGPPAPVPREASGLAIGSPLALGLDPSVLRDPRLRTMLAMDLRAFERTASAQQYRLAMVHLSSVLEGVVTDYGLARQQQLGLRGLPESWKVERILDQAMGERLTPMDRPCLLQMVAARHLVRPAVQLNSPMAVTAATLEKAADFVRRVLVELGYSGGARAPAPERTPHGLQRGSRPVRTVPAPAFGPPPQGD